MLLFLQTAVVVAQASTYEVCKETKAVYDKYKQEGDAVMRVRSVKDRLDDYRTLLSNLNKDIANKRESDGEDLENLIEDLGLATIITAREMVDVAYSSPARMLQLQTAVRTKLTQTIQQAVSSDSDDLEARSDRIVTQVTIREARMRELGCATILARGPGPDDNVGGFRVGSVKWGGTWVEGRGAETVNISGGSGALVASFSYAGNDYKGSGQWSDCNGSATSIVCDWSAQHDDSTKSGTRSGKIRLTLSGDSITGELTEAEPKWSYKPGYSKQNVNSSMGAGVVWKLSYKRK